MSKFVSAWDQLKQGIPLLDLSDLIKTHEAQMTKTASIDL